MNSAWCHVMSLIVNDNKHAGKLVTCHSHIPHKQLPEVEEDSSSEEFLDTWTPENVGRLPANRRHNDLQADSCFHVHRPNIVVVDIGYYVMETSRMLVGPGKKIHMCLWYALLLLAAWVPRCRLWFFCWRDSWRLASFSLSSPSPTVVTVSLGSQGETQPQVCILLCILSLLLVQTVLYVQLGAVKIIK